MCTPCLYGMIKEFGAINHDHVTHFLSTVEKYLSISIQHGPQNCGRNCGYTGVRKSQREEFYFIFILFSLGMRLRNTHCGGTLLSLKLKNNYLNIICGKK